jgi:hypothetical protein
MGRSLWDVKDDYARPSRLHALKICCRTCCGCSTCESTERSRLDKVKQRRKQLGEVSGVGQSLGESETCKSSLVDSACSEMESLT